MPAQPATLLEYNEESALDSKMLRHVNFGGNKIVREQHKQALGHEYVFHFIFTKDEINTMHTDGLVIDKDVINDAIARRHGLKPPFAKGADVIAIKEAYMYIDPAGTPFSMEGKGELQILDNNPTVEAKVILASFYEEALKSTAEAWWGTNNLPQVHALFPNNGGGEFLIKPTLQITGGGTGSRIIIKIVCAANRWIIPPGA